MGYSVFYIHSTIRMHVALFLGEVLPDCVPSCADKLHMVHVGSGKVFVGYVFLIRGRANHGPVIRERSVRRSLLSWDILLAYPASAAAVRVLLIGGDFAVF